MSAGPPLLGGSGLFVLALYLLALLGVGVVGRLARKEESLSDFYLSGRTLGPFVLFLTLYATQYSGLTLVGFAGRAYRQGFGFLVAVTFGCSIMGGYLIIAPRLQQLSRAHGFVTPGDYLQHRYGARGLTALATAVFIFALATYILSNLKAIGYVVESATGGAIGFEAGVIGLSLLMVVYETLGGMRAVAWTDVMQGLILMVGCVAIFIAIGAHYGHLPDHSALLATHGPDKLAAPDLAGKLTWSSTLLLVSFGVSIYPHALQRIYAARDARVLRRSLQCMLAMPFVTTLLMILVGIVGAAHFPGLSRIESEQVVLIVLQDLASAIPIMGVLIVVLICALIAAIMSTVDSALLAISSLITQDLYNRYRPGASQRVLTRLGKVSSWALMALMAWLALELPQTLWRITEVKLEVLCQAAPAIFLGLHFARLQARPVWIGMALGLTVTLAILGANAFGVGSVPARPLGVHAGVWGLALNAAYVAASLVRTPAEPQPTTGSV